MTVPHTGHINHPLADLDSGDKRRAVPYLPNRVESRTDRADEGVRAQGVGV
jgi:hypothetical protein